MHQYIETVRKEIEAVSGQEAYLTSSLFLRMHLELNYEDEGEVKLLNKSDFERVQNMALNSISTPKEFDLKNEILSWQAAMIRDIAKEYYNWWLDYKDKKFLSENCFQNGDSCLNLEALCEKLGANPTEVFTNLLEVEHILTRLFTSCNLTMLEVDKYWQFKYKNKKKGPINDFMSKRIENEGKHTTLFNGVENLKEVSLMCERYGKKLAGRDHLVWMNPHHMLESLIVVLEGYLNFEYIPESELCLKTWLDSLFPKKIKGDVPNPFYMGALYHRIVANLSQATQCLVQQTTKNINAFEQRDQIVRPFIQDTLEAVKRKRLMELKESNKTNLVEQARQ